MTRMQIQHADSTGKKYSEYMYTNIPVSATLEQAQLIDTANRAIIGLTNDTYIDTTLVQSKSVNEIIAEEG